MSTSSTPIPHVPSDVVRRRYAGGLRNFFTVYQSVVDSWQVYDNADFAAPHLIASGTPGAFASVIDPNRWNHLKASS